MMEINDINVNILASGSDGNAVIINDVIMIDCGVPFKAVAPYLDKLQIVLLTHKHSDHFSRSTIKRIARDKPLIRFVTPLYMVYEMNRLELFKKVDPIMNGTNESLRYSLFGQIAEIYAFNLYHDEDNSGYRIVINKNGQKRFLLYATDTGDISPVTAKGYDLYLLEANYDENEILEKIHEKEFKGEYAYEKRVMQYHLSRQQADAWLAENADDHSRFLYMHQHRDKIKEDSGCTAE